MNPPEPSAFRAFWALVRLTLVRHWRIRTLGWVTLGLVVLIATANAVFTNVRGGWRVETRQRPVLNLLNDQTSLMTTQEYALNRLPIYEFFPGPPMHFGIKVIPIGAVQAIMTHPEAQSYRDGLAFRNFSRWIVFGLYLTCVLPLFSLAYASGAIGSEREGRTMIWLSTRPIPRGGIYLAKLIGVLPWCVLVSLIGYAALCFSGGELGRQAFFVYLPSVLLGSVALTALFHLIGAIFQRPAVVGLVYVFFFELLVANLPGSLKRLSLNYYIRSMMYQEVSTVVEVPTEQMDVYDPVSEPTAVWVLLCSAVVVTLIGMWWFSRLEPRDEV